MDGDWLLWVVHNHAIMLFLGMASHFFIELAELSTATGKRYDPWQYIKSRPYRMIISVIGALIGYALVIDQVPSTPGHPIPGWMIAVVGFSSDSMIKQAANIMRNKIGIGGGDDK